jgi:hypothetical protein
VASRIARGGDGAGIIQWDSLATVWDLSGLHLVQPKYHLAERFNNSRNKPIHIYIYHALYIVMYIFVLQVKNKPQEVITNVRLFLGLLKWQRTKIKLTTMAFLNQWFGQQLFVNRKFGKQKLGNQ